MDTLGILDGYVGYTAAGWLQRAGSGNKAGFVIEYCGHISVGGSGLRAAAPRYPVPGFRRVAGVRGPGALTCQPTNQRRVPLRHPDDSQDHAQKEMESLRR